MKAKKWLCLLVLFFVTLTMSFPAMGQDTTSETGTISTQEFYSLLQTKFPGVEPATGMATVITYEQALAILCEALGMEGLTATEYLAFAIENDLIPGVVFISAQQLTKVDAQKMVAAFAACQDDKIQQMQQDLLRDTFVLSSGTQQTGAVPSASESSIYIPDVYPTTDYNNLNAESYGNNEENRFLNPVDSPFSTFALDVDTASYSNIRRCLLGGYLPDKGAIRIEEMLNYFDYELPSATADEPVSVTTELNVCPWNQDHLLAMIALSSYAPDKEELPGSNLVFLVDVSGSMEAYNRLPLARKALKLLVSQLDAGDCVSIVTYAGTVGVLLDTTSADDKTTIGKAIDSMNAYGSTNGAGGIQAAYQKAKEAYIDGGNNRVILLTDGDFNVGVHSASELEALIEQERDNGIYLSVLGFGMGNLKDYEMETLADRGNGNYAYIDTLKEAKKVLVDDMTSTIYTVAKDVKLQVEFNPDKVAAYRLIGYENRLLATEDFTDDQKDAGEMGAGHQMIALYEIVPAIEGETTLPTTESRYQERTLKNSVETLYVSVRYKLPDSMETLETGCAVEAATPFDAMSGNMAFAAAVAEYGLLLLDSDYKGNASLDGVIDLAIENLGSDVFGYRTEFVQLLDLTRLIKAL